MCSQFGDSCVYIIIDNYPTLSSLLYNYYRVGQERIVMCLFSVCVQIKNLMHVHITYVYHSALASLGNMVYAIGGSDGQQYIDCVEYYDPSKLQWVSSTSLPSPRFTPAAVTLSRRTLNQ